MVDLLTETLLNPATEVAQRLLGCELVRDFNKSQIVVKIVETEAYDQTDRASHSYNGMSRRTEVMFGRAGLVYVYFTYGLHYCCNIVTGPLGQGAAVLIRAVEPIIGQDVMRKLRPNITASNLSNGPAILCKALGIDMTMNGHDLHSAPLQLVLRPALHSSSIVQTTRIGISHAKEAEWRFYIRGNEYVSKL